MVDSGDGRLTGYLDRDLRQGKENLLIKLRPELQCISYRMVAMNETESALFRSAIGKMMFQYASTNYRKTLSLSDYAQKSILTKDESDYLQKRLPHLVGPHPDIQADWPNLTLRIQSLDRPVSFLALDGRKTFPESHRGLKP